MTSDLSTLSIDRVPLPRRRTGTRVILPLMLVAAAIGTTLFAMRDALWPAPLVRVEPVVATTALAGGAAGTTTVTAPGWIAPDPFPTRVVALTDGVVAEVLVLDGDRVEKGQVVARLVADDARIALKRAIAVEDQALAVAAALEIERAATPAAVTAAEAAITATREELRLKEPLAVEGTIAVTEVSRLHARLRGEEAALARARAQTAILEARARQLEAGLAIAAADAEAAELRLQRTEIRSSAAGVVLRRIALPGSVLRHAGDAARAEVLELYDPSRLMVRVDVPFADAARVTLGQRAVVTVEALPARELRGHVVRAVHEANAAKNTVAFHVALDETDAALRPEMIARVRLVADARPAEAGETSLTALFVPRAAIRGGRVLVVVGIEGDRGRIAVRQPSLGGERDGYVEVRDGLLAGDRVVVDGAADLADGQLVRLPGGVR